MAKVINIRCKDFDEISEETVTYGDCSKCGNELIHQWIHGFPTVCPYCGSELKNGKDDREWVRKSAYGADSLF